MAHKDKKSETVAVRLEPDLKRVVHELAEQGHRTMSQEIRRLIIEALAASGLLSRSKASQKIEPVRLHDRG